MDELADRYPALNGGALCLDFANTLEPKAEHGQDRDHLGTDRRHADHAGLLAWLEYAQVIDDGERRQLTALARQSPPTADDAVAAAVDLRAAVTAVFSALAAHAALPPDAHRLRDAYARAVKAATLEPATMGLQWSWNRSAELMAPLHLIAVSAAELATSTTLARVKQCDGENCWVLFIDTSKNASRRWCQMRYCGNVAKSHRQAARRRQARAASSPRHMPPRH
ncbi:CGNR zinc finger domain-containing protein [Kribbella sp. NPDC023855]|uniref:CGNR zinc finger domain-containing protein n=1 Tax=Kribbella sp. NPDC023855 TaxID=3154698 RepID=UPI00340AC783